MESPSAEQQLEAAAILAEPVRRSLYLYVARQPADIGRDEAAKAIGIDRALAAFHLEKLVEAGLLDVTYRRLSGRTGPGAGRPSKLYRRSSKVIELTVPERRYEMLARLLVGAVGSSRSAGAALAKGARTLGQQIGAEARAAAGPRPDRERLLRSAMATLDRMGFHPAREAGGTIRLRNCPFDALAKERRDVVCAMNVDLMDGVLDGLRASGIAASFEPTAGTCCVALRRRSEKAS